MRAAELVVMCRDRLIGKGAFNRSICTSALLAMVMLVASVSVEARTSPCGDPNERACCVQSPTGAKDTQRNMRSRSGLNDCEKELFAVPGCSSSNKSGTCQCDNYPPGVNAVTTCRTAKWVVDNVKGTSKELREILADAKDVIEKEAAAAARKLEEETRKAQADFQRGAEVAAAQAKNVADQVARELNTAFGNFKEEAVCRAVLGAVQIGKAPGGAGSPMVVPGLESAIRAAIVQVSSQRLTAAQVKVVSDQIKRQVTTYSAPLVYMRRQAEAQQATIRDAFSPDILCSKDKLLAKLKGMNPLTQQGGIFTSQSLSVGAAGVVGVQLSISYVFNWNVNNPQYGVVLSVGPTLAPLTAGAGASYGVQFYPRTTLAGFSGLGYGMGASAGTPVVEGSVGVDFSYPFPFDPWQPVPSGMGFNIGGGANAIPTPVEFSTGVSQSWILWQYPSR